jgi:hypothetical protein
VINDRWEIQKQEQKKKKKGKPFPNCVFKVGALTRVYPKVSGLSTWSENCKWHSSLPLRAVVSLFYESV